MSSDKLTALAVRRATKPGLYGDGKNLYLRVGKGDAKSWVLRYMVAGRPHEMGLGSAADFSLKEARERARLARQQLADGRDPIAARRIEGTARRVAAAKAMTFRQCAEAYIAAHRAGWKNPKHAAQWPSTLETYVFPFFGGLPVTSIDTGLVMKAVEPIWSTKPETASRIRGRIESVLDWAAARGYRQGENPARWKGHLDNLLPKATKAKAAVRRETGRGEHHAALPYGELPGFLAELRGRDGLAAKALEFAILTAARTGEVIGADWSEIDLEGRLWTIPADRMKAGKEHRVPLSDAAAAILAALSGNRTGMVFPISNMAMLMTLRRMGRGDLTAHGFRSSFSDWCAEQTTFPAEVREMALAHTVGDKVEAAYRRGDLFAKRQDLAEAWARYCAGEESTDNVVPLRRVAE